MKILLVSHYGYALGIKKSVDFIMGENELITCELDSDGHYKFEEKLSEIFSTMGENEEVCIFVDIFGGTPCNKVLYLINKVIFKTHIFSGVNLPMILQALMEEDFNSLVRNVIENKNDFIINVTALIKDKLSDTGDE